MGLPKTNDASRGYCSQIAIFTKKNDFSSKFIFSNNELEENDKLIEEIHSIDYPFGLSNLNDFAKVLKQNYKFKGLSINIDLY